MTFGKDQDSSEIMKRTWQREDYRNLKSKQMSNLWKNKRKILREQISLGMKKFKKKGGKKYKNYLQKQKKSCKERFQDKEFREKHRERIKEGMNNSDVIKKCSLGGVNCIRSFVKKTWAGYRSYLEWFFVKQLEKLSIQFEYEKRFKFNDRFYLPDFYLSNFNFLVEIDGGFGLKDKNKDIKKCEIYREHGFNFIVLRNEKEIFEFLEVIIN